MTQYFYQTECSDINDLRNFSVKNRWLEDDFVYSEDIKDLDKLSDNELDFYKFIFTFLSAADDLVNINLSELLTLFDQKDIHHYYIEQESIECVHSRTYAAVQLVLFRNDNDARISYIEENITHPTISKKVNWLQQKVKNCCSVPEKYLLMILIEGIFFVSSFASIAYLRTLGGFNSLCRSNDLISRDEAIHTQASCLIYNNYLKHHPKVPEAKVRRLFRKAVKIECNFLAAKIKDIAFININAIQSFVRFSADRLLEAIGYDTLYNEPPPKADFPLTFMYTDKNTNFFESRDTNYSGTILNDL